MEMSQNEQAPLVPRFSGSEYEEQAMSERRAWVESSTEKRLETVGKGSIPSAAMRGNIENCVGTVQIPLGVAGPLRVEGEHAKGVFYVPLATTEGALVRSYERGMALITRSGGAVVRIQMDENQICPVFPFSNVATAATFARGLPQRISELKQVAESTTQHGELLAVEPWIVGRDVNVTFRYATGDAHGMNMIVRATEAACRWLVKKKFVERYLLFSGMSSEKRPSARALLGGKGKKVTAGVEIPARWSRVYLRSSPEAICELWQRTVIGNVVAGAVGYCGHYANGLTALFIACGQDVANVANAAIGLTNFEVTSAGDLYASVTLSSLVVATVGGGVDLPTSAECLDLLDCRGAAKAKKFAEIVAATLLAGELSFAGALVTGEFANAHEQYGRNRPID